MKLITSRETVNGRIIRRLLALPEKKCKVCDLPFQPATRKSFFCSMQCSKKYDYETNKEARTAKVREWYYKNKEYASERNKRYYKKEQKKILAQAAEYRNANKSAIREKDNQYKNKTRHGSNREQLIAENGLVCSKCGKEGERFDIVTHHTTFDKKDHTGEVLLCRSCHAREHGINREPIEIDCLVCGAVFEAKSVTAKYCSRKCKRKAEYMRGSEKIKARVQSWREKNADKHIGV